MSSSSKQPVPLDNSQFTFLSKAEYLEELISRLKQTQTGDRFLLMTHTLNVDEPALARLIDELADAASRGVSVKFTLDERTFPILQSLPLNVNQQKIIQVTKAALQKLENAGVIYTITNKSYKRLVNSFAGRSHIKLAIINDEIYIGGCNLDNKGKIDMMVRWHDKGSADWLYNLMCDVVDRQNTRLALGEVDQSWTIDSNTKLLLDVGKAGQSVIYNEALKLIDNAEEWIVMTSAVFPSSLTAKHLAAAYKRGVNVSLYFNHPSKHPKGHNILHHIVLVQEKSRRPSALFDQQLHKDLPFLHAKLLASEKGAMIGSHNYIAAGVTFGTTELTLVRYDSQFAKSAVRHFHQQLSSLKS